MHESKTKIAVTDQLADVGTERALLSVLVQNGADAFYDVSDIIGSSSFTNENNQAIYQCIETIVDKKHHIDIPTIIAQAEELNLTFLVCKEKTDLEYLGALFNFPASSINARNHAKKLAKLEIARQAKISHFEAIKAISNITGSENIDEIVSLSEAPIFDLINKLNKGREEIPKKIDDNLDAYLEFLENNENVNTGIKTPFPIWNSLVGGGMRRGGVNLWAARPKCGKSTIALNTALHLSKQNIPVLYLDTEMTLDEQLPRIISNITNIPIGTIEAGKLKNTTEIKKKISNLPFYHKVIAGKNFESVLAIIRRWILQEVGYGDNGRIKDCLVIYDYFKIMDTDELSDLQEYQAMGFQISKLTDFAKEYDFACMAFTQTNRDGITKDSSDVVSQSDRLVWLCHSLTLFKKKTSDEIVEDGADNGNIKFKPIASRFGPEIEDNNHINVKSTGNTFQMKEVNTRFDVINKQRNNESGFGGDLKVDDF